eukprot:TRINITY_DN8692_c0_g1_i1.p1 TRINITY_DN8692_c0_g1~~TRINITY_DN8692_c0_g1_i1.p1  ORF type:complete len:390 (-),score=63.80 TRINITY_DN8692_c0_g1_i1:131-1300(-)
MATKEDVDPQLREKFAHMFEEATRCEMKSFGCDEEEQYTEYFDRYGFVVIDGVIDPEQCDRTLDEVWKLLFSHSGDNSKLDRNDLSTWDEYWPLGVERSLGIVGHFPVVDTCAWQNRTNPRLYRCFSHLLQRSDLWVSIDRYGYLRPTKDIEIEADKAKPEDLQSNTPVNGKITVQRPKWKTSDKWLHWDLNPWYPFISDNVTSSEDEINQRRPKYDFPTAFIVENNDARTATYRRVQGLIALADTREEDGGFQTVPGFLHHLSEWADATRELAEKNNKTFFVSVPKNHPIVENTRKIPMKKGSLLIWDSRMPHSNYPNSSNHFRACQYIKMFAASPDPSVTKDEELKMREMIKAMLPEDLEMDEISKKLLRQDYWPNERHKPNSCTLM